MKKTKGVVRVIGSPAEKEKVFDTVEKAIQLLDAGELDGRKTVRV